MGIWCGRVGRSWLLLATSIPLLAGCSSERFVGRDNLAVVQHAALPIPDARDSASVRAYMIGPLDRLIVGVYGASDLSGKVQVDAGGKVLLPLIGAVDAAGKTPSELSAMIAGRLRGRYVRDPDVSVTLDEYNQIITVEGGVQKPGSYPALGNMTLMRAIASGGGISDSGNTKYVVVFRQAQGHQIAGLYDLRAIHQGIYPDPDIYPNDVVMVGDSAGRRYFQMAVQAGSLLTAPLIAIFR